MAQESSERIRTMKIGIDISQIVYEGTGVGRYVTEMVRHLLAVDKENEYILFGSSLRQQNKFYSFFNDLKNIYKNVSLKVSWLPPSMLDVIWNQLHVIPIEKFIGNVDIFWSSDWTQPPLEKARGMTTIHDVSFLHFPESFDAKILAVQKRRLAHSKKECQTFLCDSEATKQDVVKLLGIDEKKLHVIYPGFTL